ncbi:MAG: chromate transporter [Pseudomonadota bacterium]
MSGAQEQQPSLSQALWVWLKIGWLSFGGPAAQIALMHREMVQQRQWLTEQRFLNRLDDIVVRTRGLVTSYSSI